MPWPQVVASSGPPIYLVPKAVLSHSQPPWVLASSQPCPSGNCQLATAWNLGVPQVQLAALLSLSQYLTTKRKKNCPCFIRQWNDWNSIAYDFISFFPLILLAALHSQWSNKILYTSSCQKGLRIGSKSLLASRREEKSIHALSSNKPAPSESDNAILFSSAYWHAQQITAVKEGRAGKCLHRAAYMAAFIFLILQSCKSLTSREGQAVIKSISLPPPPHTSFWLGSHLCGKAWRNPRLLWGGVWSACAQNGGDAVSLPDAAPSTLPHTSAHYTFGGVDLFYLLK